MIKYLEYITLLNFNCIIIFFHHFLIEKFKFKFNNFYNLIEICVSFEIKEDVCIILLNFKEVKIIF